MPTLEDLRAAVLPAARPLPGASLDRAVGWVRVLRARVPAFDALDAGDVVILPAAALAHVAPGPVEVDGLAVALAGPPAAGLILLDPDDDDPLAHAAADALARAASAAGLPGLRAGREDPAAIE
ncbi:MAG TPA: hypothetical protein VM344_09340, partial [Vitreimonas sp.]|nr:hypothetical protein [Vitreimonas sp.]